MATMVAPVLGTAWAQTAISPDPWWVPAVPALASVAVCVWTALMGARQARRRGTRVVSFRPHA
jgi:H+/Cl- antiporter ClcA